MRLRSGRASWRCVNAFLLVVSLGEATAHAGESAVHLVYMRGAGAERCPSQAELQQGVIARLGRDPFWGGGARPVWLTISRSGAELVATIAVQAEDGGPAQVRAVTSRRHECAELAAAVELALAIAIDPDAALGVSPAAPSDSPERVERASRPARLPDPAAGASESPTRVTSTPGRTAAAGDASGYGWFAGAALLVSSGSAPALSAGVALDVGARRRDWSLMLEGRADYPSEAPMRNGAGAVAASPVLAAVVPCRHLRWFAGCLVAAAGMLFGSARGVPDAHVDVTPYLASGVRLATEFALGTRFALGARVDLLATLTPTHLRVDGMDVWRTPAASATLGISAIERFW
ncbi:MAG TPA: hypothetical protein VHO67_22415 [Polyangia bacterium]|nr:hypothetical protein [Polyangia bacterium]